MKFSISVICVVIASGCGKSQRLSEKSQINPGSSIVYADEIALINVGKLDRCGIGELVATLSRCKPKVIGINLMLRNENNFMCDSILTQSMIEADNVILSEGFVEGKHVETAKKFSDAAYLVGVMGLSQRDDGLTNSYYRQIDFRGKWEYSFPFLLALTHDKNRGSELAAKTGPQDYPLVLHEARRFKMLEHDSSELISNCEMIHGRIVIIGYLGPDSVDIYTVKNSLGEDVKIYGTTLIANAIIDILKDLDQ
ncbi:CHASE2 domain-containing protein [Chryseolinea sp. H1M3-3]|uniref:CHASE2 domain-containing protein n=1 Tax=Chryseolinea sp. H1M3-3 TaxID=3034144 RepID=UPI0023ED2101|nr:CHASE2 domain-containing protein [Chryseolinea sp. H1M3-3]